MPDPKAPVAPVAKAPAAPAANPPAANALAIDERFAQLAAQFMMQVNAQVETLRQEFATQFSTNVDPLHKDLHDLLDMQTQVSTRVDALEALQPAPAAGLDGLQEQVRNLATLVARQEQVAPTIQPVLQVTDASLADRVARLETKLRFF